LLFIPLLLVSLKSQPEKHSKYFRFWIKELLPVIVFVLGVKIEVSGLEKVDKSQKLFFICNHQHDFDPAILLNLFPDNWIAPIGKKDILTEKPFIAKVMHKLDGLFIDRENDRKAVETIVAASKKLKQKKVSILIFPEGYTSKTCELLPFRNGAFKIAYKAQAPIAVCVLNNTQQITKNMFRRKTVVNFKVIDVLKYEDYKDLSTVELGEKLHIQMKNELENLKKSLS
jgi:1-acyl-sn-glycerol-3-phosphate acyltransferase